ncbi:MAG: hypothetical protein KME18_07815 [Phormidium tanganyikae FI6-MK23]|nr:hypothetical protein [Phormidium tanganyikae FI6-MK23]
MTIIKGKLTDSGGVAFGGSLRVTLDAPLLDGDTMLVPKPRDYQISAAGEIDITLPQSETSQITYRFEIRDSRGLVIPAFSAIVPNVVECDFWELIPIGAQTDLLPAGLRRIAQLLVSDPGYASTLRWFRPEGNYSPAIFYSEGSLVSFGGGSYLYVNSNPTKGNTPSSNSVFWQLIAARGEAGASGSTSPTPAPTPNFWFYSTNTKLRSNGSSQPVFIV